MTMTVKMLLEQKGRNVLTLTGEESLHETCQILSKHKVGAALVVDAAGKMQGIVSERDVVKSIAVLGEAGLIGKIRTLMTTNVTTCSEGDAVVSLMKRMTDGRFRHMPVLEAGSVVGIISIGDVVKSRMEEMELEVSSMRDYIHQ